MEYTYSVFRPNPRATTHGADSKSANSSACSSRWRTNQRIEELEKEKEQLDYERALALKRLSPRALNALASHTAVVLCRHQRRHLIQTPSGVTMREAKQLGMALAGGIGYDGCASHNDVRSGLGSVTSYSNSELGDILCASEHDVAASALASLPGRRVGRPYPTRCSVAIRARHRVPAPNLHRRHLPRRLRIVIAQVGRHRFHRHRSGRSGSRGRFHHSHASHLAYSGAHASEDAACRYSCHSGRHPTTDLKPEASADQASLSNRRVGGADGRRRQ